MSSDDYILGRDYLASIRLNSQHYLWGLTFGYLLHPKVPSLTRRGPSIAIADVGTGTGVFLLELARHLQTESPSSSSSSISFTGLDVSTKQFPRPEWLPQNIQMIQCDALDPKGPPPELVGKFDIVNARFLLGLVQESPAALISFCTALLKPGGYLQWGEPFKDEVEVDGYERSSTDATRNLMRIIKGPVSMAWIMELPKTLEDEGLEIVAVDRKQPLPWQRGWFIDSFCMALAEFGRVGLTKDDPGELIEKVLKEKAEGTWATTNFQIVVARKRQAERGWCNVSALTDLARSWTAFK